MNLSQEIQHFVDNGRLKLHLKRNGDIVFPHIRFVFFDTNVMQLLIFVGGKCPKCGLPSIKNTCNLVYTERVLGPIIKRHFPYVINVMPLLTCDSNFVNAVSSIGGTIGYAFTNNQKMKQYAIQKMFFDGHPDIDATMKLSYRLREDTSLIGTDVTTPNRFLDTYQVWWLVDDTTAVVVEGKYIKGKQNIVSVGNAGMPSGTVLHKFDDTYYLIQTEKAFFDEKRYIVVDFTK